MKTLLLIYIFSYVISIIRLYKLERKLSLDLNLSWAIALIPGWNTVIAVSFILSQCIIIIERVFGKTTKNK